jgi:acetylornithine deacetylase
MERLVRNVLDWVAIPSVTGSEAAYGDALARECRRVGLDVELQEVQPGRANVLARGRRPRVVLCTHVDTVPGDLGVREDREYVYGRGACDAKGPAAAMLLALERLLASGEDRVGALFTVGEETDSAGAACADARLAEPWSPAYTVIGEPTDNRFVAAGKGIWKARLVAQGSAGHSSQAGGPSAVHELVRCVHGLLGESWGTHPVLGPGTLNVGTIAGGVAPNVVAEHAECELLVRAVEDPQAIGARVARHLGPHVRVEKAHKGCGPIEFALPAGEAGIAVAFGTDAPHMRRWGQPLLFGPGSILDAHTEHEKVSKRALAEAAARYESVVRELLERVDAR